MCNRSSNRTSDLSLYLWWQNGMPVDYSHAFWIHNLCYVLSWMPALYRTYWWMHTDVRICCSWTPWYMQHLPYVTDCDFTLFFMGEFPLLTHNMVNPSSAPLTITEVSHSLETGLLFLLVTSHITLLYLRAIYWLLWHSVIYTWPFINQERYKKPGSKKLWPLAWMCLGLSRDMTSHRSHVKATRLCVVPTKVVL